MSTYMKYLATPVGALAIISNMFVIILFVRNKVWLKKPYNVFIINLACTDLASGALLLFAPGLSFTPAKVPANNVLGHIYCQTIAGYWLFFAFGAVSVYTSLFLTIERWTAICRPLNYRSRFSGKHFLKHLALIWILGLGTSRIGTLKVSYRERGANMTAASCITTTVFGDKSVEPLMTIVSVSLKFFIPSAIIIVLYIFAIRQLYVADRCFEGNHVDVQKDQMIRNVTKLAAIASFALIACWLPNQIYLILFKYQKVRLFSHTHNFTIVLVSVNSTLNPFIYALCGKQYRAGFKALLCLGCDGENRNVTSDILSSGQDGNFTSKSSRATEKCMYELPASSS